MNQFQSISDSNSIIYLVKFWIDVGLIQHRGPPIWPVDVTGSDLRYGLNDVTHSMFFFPVWNRYPQKKITQKIELVTWHWASNISIYVFVPYIIADVTGSMWRYWLNVFSVFFLKKLSQYDDIEPVRCPELVRCHWASTMTLSQYDDTDSTVRPTFLVGPSEMKENDSFYHPQNSPWQQSFWFLSSDYIRTLENWASKEIWDGTQNEVDWVQKDSIIRLINPPIKVDECIWISIFGSMCIL